MALCSAGWRTVLITALSISLLGQASPQAVIEGRVVRAGTNTPIEDVFLKLMRFGKTLQEWDDQHDSTKTLEDGRFIFEDLQPGTYLIAAEKQGYATQIPGARGFGEPAMVEAIRGGLPTEHSLREIATVFTVTAGQALRSNIVVALTPTGVITGRVLGRDGRPVVDTEVRAVTDLYTAGGARVSFALDESSTTDDRGEFRLLDIPPGRYHVVASPSDEQEATYARNSFYPGLLDFDKAVPITVVPGREVRLPTFSLQPANRMYRITGRLIDRRAQRTPPGEISVEVAARKPGATLEFEDAIKATLSAEGYFVATDVPAGDYWISASVSDLRVLGLTTIRVGGNLDGVSLNLEDPLTVRGRVTFDAQTPPGPADMSRIGIGLELPEVPFGPLMLSVPSPVEPEADGTFIINGLFSGEFRAFATTLPGDMYLKDIRFRGVRGLDRLITLNGTPSELLEIEIGTRGGQLRGIVMDDKRQPVANVQAVLVPRGSNPHPDLFRKAYSDAAGRYALRGIAPGEYTLLAWADPETSYFNPEFVRRFLGQGKAVRVSEGSNQNVDVQVVP